MPETGHLEGYGDWVDSDFVQNEETSGSLMALNIEPHVAELSIENTISILYGFGVDRARSTVHDRVQKAGSRPAADQRPDHVAVDGTVIWWNDQRYRLFAAVDPKTNEFLHDRPFSTRYEWPPLQFFRRLQHRRDVADATVLVDNSWTLRRTLDRLGLEYRHQIHGRRNGSLTCIRKNKTTN